MSARITWHLPVSLRRLLEETPELRGARLVGGCVRDALLGLESKDLDFEVLGVSLDALVAALGRWGATDLVGRSFGVAKLRLPDGTALDFSVPRRDSKTGGGHRGFAVELDPGITPREAAGRRDFTINALSSDPRTGEVFDEYGGLADLEARVLRHTTAAFVEDPLRVLRGMQFAARFDLDVAPETVALCRSLADAFGELPRERVREEWWKWACSSKRPSRGPAFLRDCGWLRHFPELEALIGVRQDPGWHPEGDVWTHTMLVVDRLADSPAWRGSDEATRGVLMLAALAHDLGKPPTTHVAPRDGGTRLVSPGHDVESGPLAAALLARMGMPAAVAERVRPLVVEHMAHLSPPSPRSVRRLSSRLRPATIVELATVIAADAAGRPPLPPDPPRHLVELLRIAEELSVAAQAPAPLVLGRHLLAEGWVPGPEMGAALQQAFQAQLDGEFADVAGGVAWIARHVPRG
jgi:tRNA nucleotidyltransferase (CCA-adding enzyme)